MLTTSPLSGDVITTKIVAVDFDDVLVPCLEYFVDFCRESGLGEGTLEGLYGPWFEAIFPSSSRKESQNNFEKFVTGDHWENLHKVPPPPGCLEKLTQMKASGCKLLVVSAREHRFQEITERYLEEFLPNLFDKVVLCNYYGPKSGLVEERRSKADVCQQEGCNWLIDDNYGYVKEVEEAMVGTKCILMGSNSWSLYWKDHWISLGGKHACNWEELSL